MRPPLPLIFLSIERRLVILGCQHKINTPLIYQVQDKTTRWFINSRRTITHESPTTTEYTTTYLQTQKNINSQTYHPNNSRYINSSTYNPINSQTQKETPTHQLVSSQTHKLQTHQLTNPSTQKVKILTFILQHRFNFHSVLAKI